MCTMQSLLCSFLIGALLGTGTCLECEVCSGMGHTCKGAMRTCGAREDTCVAHHVEGLQCWVTWKTIAKGCGSSSICNASVSEVNLGKGMQVRMKSVCCTGDACQTASPPELPPLDVTPNGLQCPGCFGVFSSECQEQTVACTGSQNKCIRTAGNVTSAGLRIEVASKGCANEVTCEYLKPGFSDFGGSRVELTEANCAAALSIPAS